MLRKHSENKSGNQVTWSKDAYERQYEDNLCVLSFDEVTCTEDARLRTEELEEEDEKEREEYSGMSSASIDKLQILWDHFIHAESQSYEKSSWLDIFLAELLAQIKEGRDVKDVLSFCSLGSSGVSTLVACELLSDVNKLCTKKNDCGELTSLQKYLVQDRGWRCLAILHLLGIRGLSCGRELVALLVALYPVTLQQERNDASSSSFTSRGPTESPPSPIRNPYVKFYGNDDIIDNVDIVSHVITKRKSVKSARTELSYEENASSRKRPSRKYTKLSNQHKRQSSTPTHQYSFQSSNATSSESESVTDGIDQARSFTLKIRLNPMDFEYFTTVVRSGDDEQKCQAELYELPPRPVKKIPRDYADDRIKNVLDARISNFEISLLIIQLLQDLRDYDTPAEQTPAVQVLKFAVDTLWSLQFGIDSNNLNRMECAALKAAASRLMLIALERAVRADEPTTTVIHNGLLPMTLTLLEDACSKPPNVLEPEEGSLLQEFIFATIYGIVTFLYCLLYQYDDNAHNFSDFLELFQVFIKSQDGKLLKRTIFTIVDLPNIEPAKSIVRAGKIIDMIGALINILKCIRSHGIECKKTKYTCYTDDIESYHHSDKLGMSYSEYIDGFTDKHVCCVSSLFATLVNLLKKSHLFVSELRVKLVELVTVTGTCCCFSPQILISSVVIFLKKCDNLSYAPVFTFLERGLFQELGVFNRREICGTCHKLANYPCDFLKMYVDLLNPDNSKLCYVVMVHLFKILSNAGLGLRRSLLFEVFYPIFLRTKACFMTDSGNSTAKFLLQSCMAVITWIITFTYSEFQSILPIYERFKNEMNGLHEILDLMTDATFMRSIYALLRVAVIIEIYNTSWSSVHRKIDDLLSSETCATTILFQYLDRETDKLLKSSQYLEKTNREDNIDQESEDIYDVNNQKAKSLVRNLKMETNEIAMKSANDIGSILKLSENNTHSEQLENKTDTINVVVIPNLPEKFHTSVKEDIKATSTDDTDAFRISNLYQASTAWKAAASIALYMPTFRHALYSHSVSRKSLYLLRLLSIDIATGTIEDTNKSAQKLFEALVSCCLMSPLYYFDVDMELRKLLINAGITLSRGIAVIVDALLKVSMLKPKRRNELPPSWPLRLPTTSLEDLSDYEAEDSSTGEYFTTDDGYEADIEVPREDPRNSIPQKNNPFGLLAQLRGHASVHPALCSLAMDLLIHFSEQGLDLERRSIVTDGLRKIAITCRESASTCATLADSGTIMKILHCFENIFINNDPQYQDLQHAALEVFTLLAMQSILPTELIKYLSFFKAKQPPLLSLLEPLYHLILAARSQPNFILLFPIQYDTEVSLEAQIEEHQNLEKIKDLEHLINNHRRKESLSPWAVHAICFPVGPEMSWPIWLHGCSISMWLRVERGSFITDGNKIISCNGSIFDESGLELIGSEHDLHPDKSSWQAISASLYYGMMHIVSIGFKSFLLEIWFDVVSDNLIFQLSRSCNEGNTLISMARISDMLPTGVWHHLALNLKEVILDKNKNVIEVTFWIDGWKEANVQLPFNNSLIKKPSTTYILLGHIAQNKIGALCFGNIMAFRCPVFTKERALYLTSLGPNYTSLADCILNTIKPDFASLIAFGALDGVCEVKYEGSKHDPGRRKSYGDRFVQRPVETIVMKPQIDWDAVMDATNSHLNELQDNLLLSYEAQNPNIAHLYPQAIANVALMRSIFPGQTGFRFISAPEHRVSQQPPLSISPIISSRLVNHQYRGLVPTAILVGGVPVFLYLFARVVELNSSEEEQALALSIILHLIHKDSELLNQYRLENGTSLLLHVLQSSRCHAGKPVLKAILDAACDSSIIIKDVSSDNHLISQNCEAVIIDAELIKGALTAWRAWAKYDTLTLLLQALLFLLRDQHSQREFNASQLNRVGIVNTILTLCKEHFMYEELGAVLDPFTGTAIVELIRALMGAPPEFAHLVAITDYLILVHQASETYVTHSRHNMYFMLPQLSEKKVNSKRKDNITVVSSDDPIDVENDKLNKALTNVQIQKNRTPKRKEHRSTLSKDTSAGEDSGIAASDGSNPQSNEKQSTPVNEKGTCRGLICEGLLLLLRDAVRVLPDSQVGSVLKHVLRAELLLVLANNPDARVRTALVKVIQVYLQRASDEEINKFIKHKYFMHLGNQIALYRGSEPLVVALENLVLWGQTLAAMPPLMAMIAKIAGSEPNITRPIISFITDMIAKNTNALKILLEQGLIESLAQALIATAQKSSSTSFHRDVHVLFVTIATKLLELPGGHQMQVILDLHAILDYVELAEKLQCRTNATYLAIRETQVALFDGELDALATKILSHSGFRLRSTASYLASASYLSSALTTSGEQSDHGSRSSSYTNLYTGSSAPTREPGKGELNDRFRIIVTRAVEFITTADSLPSNNELQLTRRLFSILLHGLCSPLEKKSHWSNAWSAGAALRKYTAKIMIWLLEPHQSINTRVYAIRSLMEEPRAREILSCILEVHPQTEQKFTVFFWDLLQKRDEMPSADARVCIELKEALRVWDLAKEIEQANAEVWNDELSLLRQDFLLDREISIENYPVFSRISKKYDGLAKQLIESAMTITRTVVEEQNRERKALMEQLKHTRALEAEAIAKWRDLAKRLTHERAPWHFPESYPKSWELDPTEGPARVRTRLQRCHLNIDKKFFLPEHQDKLTSVNTESPLLYLFTCDSQDSNASTLIERLHTSERIRKMSQVKVVTPRAELAGEILIGETCLYFVPDNPDIPLHHADITLGGLDLAVAGGAAWRFEDIRELHKRRYQLQEKGIEIFLITGRTYLLAFNTSKERDEFAIELFACSLPRRIPGDDLGGALTLWRNGVLTNWEYITCLNKLAGRSYNDLMQYHVFPFVLADYISENIDLNNPLIYRNFKRPMAVQDKKNEQHYINNYNYLKQAVREGLNLISLNQEPFHYGSHYSNSGTVLHFLVRLPPFTSMFLCYQDNNFDIPDRTFHALATTWRLTSCDSTTDVKELIPEFFYLPEFLLNCEGFDFGIRQNGNTVGDVGLPKWCNGDARIFILAHRAALETNIVREVLPYWIDLVFGFRQTGRRAIEAINVFHPATYYGFDVEQIADPLERQAWETMVRTYGQTPAQLFKAAHPLPIQNLSNVTSNQIPQVIKGVSGLKWGDYVGAPGNEPILCWKHKHRFPLTFLVPLTTGDVFGLPNYTALLLSYTKEKGSSMLNSMSVLGAALASWSGTDGIVRLKCKKEQPPKPLIRSLGLDPITTLGSTPDCGQLWVGHLSGRITVYRYTIGATGKVEFNLTPASILLAHRNRVTVITLSRAFSIGCSGDSNGITVIWDLNSLMYVRSIVCDQNYAVHLLCISETLGDIAVTYDIPAIEDRTVSNGSELKVHTINVRPVGSVSSERRITALCYSNAPEGVSVNVIATGLDNGTIRLWSSWDLQLIKEIAIKDTKECGAVIAVTWALDQHHLYAAMEDSTVLIWEGSKHLSNGTPKFVNLTSL